MPKCIELNTKSKPKLISFWVLGFGPRAQEINLSLDLEFYSRYFGVEMDKCLKFLCLKICEKFETSYKNLVKFFLDFFGTKNFLGLKNLKHLLFYLPRLKIQTHDPSFFWVLCLAANKNTGDPLEFDLNLTFNENSIFNQKKLIKCI
jgi:hypothetical protein